MTLTRLLLPNNEAPRFSAYASLEALNDLESKVQRSVEKYEALNDANSSPTKKCATPGCLIAKVLTFRESWDDYLNAFKTYVEEERQVMKREEQ